MENKQCFQTFFEKLVKKPTSLNQQHTHTHHFSESKVIRGVRKRVYGPFFQHTTRYHVGLDLLQDISEDLMTDLGAS